MSPYIKAEQRPRLDYVVSQLEAARRLTPGELNYLLTKIILAWLPPKPGYAEYATLRGVLTDVSDELYRRLMAPYEDYKCGLNGEVYDSRL